MDTEQDTLGSGNLLRWPLKKEKERKKHTHTNVGVARILYGVHFLPHKVDDLFYSSLSKDGSLFSSKS